jgi:hypothetical protein
MKVREKFLTPRSKVRFDLGVCKEDKFPMFKGDVFLELKDSKTGEILDKRTLHNLVTRDGGILAARLFKDNAEPNYGAYMLAVGTGATGPLLSPDAPDARQRKLNAEIARKSFSVTTFRNSAGVAVAYPTNVVDFTCTFGDAEAVGALNEMSIISPISSNPSITHPNPNTFPTYDATLDVTLYDILTNYLSFSVISKPAGSSLTITWRFTF